MTDTAIPVKTKHVLFCHCGGERIQADLLHMIDEHLKKMPGIVTRFSDLCGIVALRRDLLSALFNADSEYLVVGCHLRTMNLLFEQVEEQAGKPSGFSHINLFESTPDQALDSINRFCCNGEGNTVYHEITEDSGWPSWYPVIDYKRCSACGQCADFCLFGVYEKNPNGVQVINPRGCKNNCPACARICPQAAIVFPKYKQGGAIGGSEKIDEIAEQSRQTRDIREILGGDIYNALEGRKLKRKSIILQEAMRRAQEERNLAIRENRH